MSRTARPGIATHYVRYTIGNVLVMAAGFVSYPVMTRLLSYSEFGIFGYVDTWLLILAGVFKLGGQHTILRFYPHRGGTEALARFGSNFVLLPALCCMALWLLALIAFGIYSAAVTETRSTIGWLMLAMLLPTMWISFVSAVFSAEERSELNVRANVFWRWLEVCAILPIIYFLSRSADGVYVGRLIAAVLVAAALLIWVRRRLPMHWRDHDIAEWLTGVRYGIPMMANELSSVLLSFVDRLMLRHLLGTFAPVGIYTVGYNLALTINTLIQNALNVAFTQVSVRQYETEGSEAVVRTKHAVLHVLVYVVAASIVGLIVAGDDALLVMAGRAKAESAPVFVLVGITYLLNGLTSICSAGLMLHKRSGTIFATTAGATVLNVLLNLFWIPAYGVMGAVWATLVSFVLFNVLRYVLCPRDLRALPDRRATVTAVTLAVLVWLVAHFSGMFGVHSPLARLVVAAVLLAALFAGPALLLDASLRQALRNWWLHRRGTLI